jgi:hypothetical protein
MHRLVKEIPLVGSSEGEKRSIAKAELLTFFTEEKQPSTGA